MFVTTPEMEHWLPPGISGEGGRFWQAFALGSDLPWFLVTVRRKQGRARLLQTMAVAWESRLQQLVEEAVEDVAAVSRVSPCQDATGRWRLDEVIELWCVTDAQDTERHGPLLFAIRGGAGLTDCFGADAPVVPAHRRLLLHFDQVQ